MISAECFGERFSIKHKRHGMTGGTPCRKMWHGIWRSLFYFCIGLLIVVSLPRLSASLEPPTHPVAVQRSAGLEAYHQGDVLTAIAIWEEVLHHFPDEVSVLRYLAHGYRDVGDDVQQIAVLDRLITHYQVAQNDREWGRMQTEKAAAYQRQGHYHQAEALLCDGSDLSSGVRSPLDNDAENSIGTETFHESFGPIESLTSLDQARTRCRADSAIHLAQIATDQDGEVAAWGRLGTGYWNQGQYDLALVILSRALEQSQALPHHPHQTALLNSLGATYASLGQRHYRYAQFAQQTNDLGQQQQQHEQARFYDESAIALFEASFEQSRAQSHLMGELHSLLNIIPVYRRFFLENRAAAEQTSEQVPLEDQAAIEEATTLFAQLPPSHEQLQLGLKLALLMSPTADTSQWQDDQCSSSSLSSQADAIALLQKLEKSAYHLQDLPMVADILGYQGVMSACAEDEATLELFYQAQLASDTPEQRYQWEWRAGRWLAARGNVEEAIALYEQAVQSVSQIRANVAGTNRDLQLDIRDRVEGLYRQLAQLKLQQLERSQQQTTAISSKTNTPSIGATSIRTASLESKEQEILASVLDTIDGLRLTELQNYLGDDCELPLIGPVVTPVAGLVADRSHSDPQKNRHTLQPQTAVINSILFPDRIAVILTTVAPSGTLHHRLHWIPVGQEEFTAFVNDFRFNLEKRSDLTQRFRPQALQLYDWMIRPFEAELRQHQVESLIFIHDGILRSVPMAVLNDGTQFLAESYNIFNTPSLKIAPSAPLQLSRSNAVLAFGLTQASTINPLDTAPLTFLPSLELPALQQQIPPRQTTAFGPRGLDSGTVLTPLPAVQQELGAIQDLLPDSQIFFDRDFTRNRLRQELTTDAPQVLHLATHARFGFDAQQTYLVTGQQTRSEPRPAEPNARPSPNYNDTINLNDLYQLIKHTQQNGASSDGERLDFLVLTACETAVGSDRDALGLAGIAIQAGVKSSLASLWQVDDQVTAELIRQFYQNLAQGHPKATALRLAQQQWLANHPTGRYSHPGYWAPFVLVGMESANR